MYERLSTIQKRNNLNVVYRDNNCGPGGGFHHYIITKNGENAENLLDVQFQCGPRNSISSVSGILDSDLLEIVRDRLIAFNKGDYKTRENACAITHIEEALMWLNKRVEDRAERNVLGSMDK